MLNWGSLLQSWSDDASVAERHVRRNISRALVHCKAVALLVALKHIDCLVSTPKHDAF